MPIPSNQNGNTGNKGRGDYKPANRHSLSTGLRAVPQEGNKVDRTGGRSDGQDINRQLPGQNISLTDHFPNTSSQGEAKANNPEIAGGIPRGYVNNDNQPKGSLQDVGSLRPDGSKRVTFGGDIFDGYGDESGGYHPDPRNLPGGPSRSGPGGAGI